MGMRFSMILGGCSGALSTLVYWAVARQFFHITHVVAILSVLAIAICLSCGLIIGSIFKLTLICGGPDFKGSAVGVAKGFVGLGAGVYATIFQALRVSDESALDFIPVLAFFFIICAVIPAWLLLPPKGQIKPDLIEIQTKPLHFYILYVSLFVLACLILVSSIRDILDEDDEDASTGMSSKSTRDYKKVAMLLIIWLGPIWSLLLLPRKVVEGGPLCVMQDEEQVDGNSDQATEEKKNLISSYQKPIPPATVEVAEEPRTDLNLTEMLQTPSAYLMLWTAIILVGSGTYKTNNVRLS